MMPGPPCQLLILLKTYARQWGRRISRCSITRVNLSLTTALEHGDEQPPLIDLKLEAKHKSARYVDKAASKPSTNKKHTIPHIFPSLRGYTPSWILSMAANLMVH